MILMRIIQILIILLGFYIIYYIAGDNIKDPGQAQRSECTLPLIGNQFQNQNLTI